MAVTGDLEEARATSEPIPQSDVEAEKLERYARSPSPSRGPRLHASVYILYVRDSRLATRRLQYNKREQILTMTSSQELDLLLQHDHSFQQVAY